MSPPSYGSDPHLYANPVFTYIDAFTMLLSDITVEQLNILLLYMHRFSISETKKCTSLPLSGGILRRRSDVSFLAPLPFSSDVFHS